MAERSDSIKIFDYVIKSSLPHSQRSAEEQGKQRIPNNLVGETSTAMAQGSAEVHMCSCVCVCPPVPEAMWGKSKIQDQLMDGL